MLIQNSPTGKCRCSWRRIATPLLCFSTIIQYVERVPQCRPIRFSQSGQSGQGVFTNFTASGIALAAVDCSGTTEDCSAARQCTRYLPGSQMRYAVDRMVPGNQEDTD